MFWKFRPLCISAIVFYIIVFIVKRFFDNPEIIILIAFFVSCCTYLITYRILNPKISRYFRLVKVNQQEYHLQKSISSICLLLRELPEVSFVLLKKDIIEKALPKGLHNIKIGDKLVVETHLFKPSFLEHSASKTLIPLVSLSEKQMSHFNKFVQCIVYRVHNREVKENVKSRKLYRLEWEKR